MWCAYIRRPESEGEVAAGMSDDRGDNQQNKRVQLNPAIKMSIEQAHAILGHSSKGKTHKTAAALGILITRGALKTCKSCATAKAKQEKQILSGKKQHAIRHVHFYATREVARASNLNHQAGQCWREQKAGHAESLTQMEAGNYF